MLAIFRMAVADYVGMWYGFDEPAPPKQTDGRFSVEAETFFQSSWATYLGDLAGLPPGTVWHEAQRLRMANTPEAEAA